MQSQANSPSDDHIPEATAEENLRPPSLDLDSPVVGADSNAFATASKGNISDEKYPGALSEVAEGGSSADRPSRTDEGSPPSLNSARHTSPARLDLFLPPSSSVCPPPKAGIFTHLNEYNSPPPITTASPLLLSPNILEGFLPLPAPMSMTDVSLQDDDIDRNVSGALDGLYNPLAKATVSLDDIAWLVRRLDWPTRECLAAVIGLRLHEVVSACPVSEDNMTFERHMKKAYYMVRQYQIAVNDDPLAPLNVNIASASHHIRATPRVGELAMAVWERWQEGTLVQSHHVVTSFDNTDASLRKDGGSMRAIVIPTSRQGLETHRDIVKMTALGVYSNAPLLAATALYSTCWSRWWNGEILPRVSSRMELLSMAQALPKDRLVFLKLIPSEVPQAIPNPHLQPPGILKRQDRGKGKKRALPDSDEEVEEGGLTGGAGMSVTATEPPGRFQDEHGQIRSSRGCLAYAIRSLDNAAGKEQDEGGCPSAEEAEDWQHEQEGSPGRYSNLDCEIGGHSIIQRKTCNNCHDRKTACTFSSLTAEARKTLFQQYGLLDGSPSPRPSKTKDSAAKPRALPRRRKSAASCAPSASPFPARGSSAPSTHKSTVHVPLHPDIIPHQVLRMSFAEVSNWVAQQPNDAAIAEIALRLAGEAYREVDAVRELLHEALLESKAARAEAAAAGQMAKAIIGALRGATIQGLDISSVRIPPSPIPSFPWTLLPSRGGTPASTLFSGTGGAGRDNAIERPHTSPLLTTPLISPPLVLPPVARLTPARDAGDAITPRLASQGANGEAQRADRDDPQDRAQESGESRIQIPVPRTPVLADSALLHETGAEAEVSSGGSWSTREDFLMHDADEPFAEGSAAAGWCAAPTDARTRDEASRLAGVAGAGILPP
ncbi:hypothetical protein OF83DRAFT_1178577 [Amylostereum chailletii]|nr:hypothetical protein OF83DRAFT_1178577 [Amylostereum chailletii]